MIVVFALVAYCQDRHRFRILDLNESDVTGRTEWNEQLAKQCVISRYLSRSEREVSQTFDRHNDTVDCSFRGLVILLQEKCI